MKSLYLWIFAILVLSSCQKKELLTGHWVSKEYFQGKPFKTIDFYTEKGYDFNTGKEKDSLEYYILFNKNSLAFSSAGSMAKEENRDNFFFLIGHSTIDTLSIKNDSIYVWGDEYSAGVFVRMTESEVLQDELFLGSGLTIKLPECHGTYLTTNDSIAKINFNIGFNHEEPDSIIINYQDVYVHFTDILKIIKEEKEAQVIPLITGGEELIKKERIRLNLNSDRNVPDLFNNKIIGIVRKEYPDINIYKASFDYKTKKLCYKLILPNIY